MKQIMYFSDIFYNAKLVKLYIMGVKVGLSGLTFQLIFCDLFKVEFYKFRCIFNIGEYINIF